MKDANLNFVASVCFFGSSSYLQHLTDMTLIKTTETNIRGETVKRMIIFRFLPVRVKALRRYQSLLDPRNNDDF
jgi:hypothetical protein